ncbi:hypothetical protein WA556_006327, partial [Blastocystis sp. ATCC 50177/Nand II]
ANLTAANKIASKPSQPVRVVEVQCTVNGVSFALSARVNESKTEVTVAVKRTAGEYASFGERRDRDVSLPVLFNDERYTVAVDAAATVAQLKGAAVQMLARRGVAVNREGAELYVNTTKPKETDVISRYAGERLVLIDRKPFGSTPLHALVFTFPSELRPTTERSLWRDKIVR